MKTMALVFLALAAPAHQLPTIVEGNVVNVLNLQHSGTALDVFALRVLTKLVLGVALHALLTNIGMEAPVKQQQKS